MSPVMSCWTLRVMAIGIWILSGCASKTPIEEPLPSLESVPPAPRREAERTRPVRLGSATELSWRIARTRVSLELRDVPLSEALERMASDLGLELIVDRQAIEGMSVTLRLLDVELGSLLDHFEQIFSIQIDRHERLLRVSGPESARLSLLIYPLPEGLSPSRLPAEFESLRELSLVSESQQGGGRASADAESGEIVLSPLESFLEQLPRLVPWTSESAWFLDRRGNLLFVRGTDEGLDQVEACLDRLTKPTEVIEIEARFVELSERASREVGVELGLAEDFPLDRDGLGRTQSAIGADSGVRLGIPSLLPGVASGLQLSVLGLLTQPRFEVVLRALEGAEDAKVISAPRVTTLNNSPATIAVTRNLPYIEDYRPVFDRTVVSGDGLTASDSDVALVATINDRNFTGIVLNVTPSVGEVIDHVQLHIQPVVRDQVDRIVISSGALVEGVQTPTITRPIIETRYLDTQLVIPAGCAAILGGLKRTETRREARAVPILGSVPLLGRLFRWESDKVETRDLMIFVTARVISLNARPAEG